MTAADFLGRWRDALLFATCLVLSVSGLACGGERSKLAEGGSGHASTGLIEVVLLPDLLNVQTTYTLHASGAVEIDQRSHSGPERIIGSLVGSLSPEETRQLIDEALAAGLPQLEPASLEKRLLSGRRITGSVIDCGSVRFQFELDSKSRGGDPAKRMRGFTIFCPSFLIERFPDEQECRAMKRILDTFARVHLEARGSQQR